MPALLYPDFADLIRALPTSRHRVSIDATGCWTETAGLGLTYPNAERRYPNYLACLNTHAGTLGYTSEQIEFFLFSLGSSF
jgi:hypothetical protein